MIGALDAATFQAVDAYLERLFVPADDALEAACAACAAAGLPPHQVSPTQGKLLMLLAELTGARAILEIGTLGGYSTIWLARSGAHVITLEIDEARAELARANVARAGLAERVQVRVGAALDTLPSLSGPFDFIFIDADKPNNPAYLAHALRLAGPGALLVADNTIRGGAVASESDDPNVRGIRAFHELLASEPRARATAIQTVGNKGYDGFTLARLT